MMSFVLMTYDLYQPAFLREHNGTHYAQPYLDHATRFDTQEQAETKLALISGGRNAPTFIVTPFADAAAYPGVLLHR